MTIGMEQLEATLRIATIVVPVALYFLLVGLLNTRRNPQLLSGRQDFALMMIALSPLVFQPAVGYFGSSLWTLLGCSAVLGLGIAMLSPRGRTLVIYNLPDARIDAVLEESLRQAGGSARQKSDGWELEDGSARLETSGFPLLRNLSLKLHGGNERLWRDFEENLHARLGRIEPEPSPLAVGFLLIATAMLVAPTALMVHQAPEIVRLLGDILP